MPAHAPAVPPPPHQPPHGAPAEAEPVAAASSAQAAPLETSEEEEEEQDREELEGGEAGGGTGEEEEEEETCGFCRFMKGGACREVFIAWEKCVDTHRESGADFVDACSPVTLALKECMEANPDYYAPLLEAPPVEGEAPVAEADGQDEESTPAKEAAAAENGRAEAKAGKS